jgi:hypothetical protein
MSPTPNPAFERKAIGAIHLLAVSYSLRWWAIPGVIDARTYWRAGLGQPGWPTLPAAWERAASPWI